jgi:hypothetical protein
MTWMGKEAVSARKKAAECLALATKARGEERSAVLKAMARSWMMLANQMDRLEATQAKIPRRRSGRSA